MEKEKAIEILTELKEKINADDFLIDDWKRLANSSIEKIFVISFPKKQVSIGAIKPTWSGVIFSPRNEGQKKQNQENQEKNLKIAQDRLANLIDEFIREINTHSIEFDENEILKHCEKELDEAEKEIQSLKEENIRKIDEANAKNQSLKDENIQKINEANATIKSLKDENTKKISEANATIKSLKDENEELKKEIPKTFYQKLQDININIYALLGGIGAVIASGAIFYGIGKDIGSTRYEKIKYDMEVKIDSLKQDSLSLASDNKKLKNRIDSLYQAIPVRDSLKKKN
ncbi:hypothetical protein [Bernardetia sp. MNP-M8]|uniref:hypothetical protein n=1 Tax=Bernardetia sp. MNP-M8 TaxID=3127470 RepID=UPI0030D4574D